MDQNAIHSMGYEHYEPEGNPRYGLRAVLTRMQSTVWDYGMGYEQYGPEGNWRSADISHGAPVPKS